MAGAVVALHFIVMRQPPSDVLPTARFIPMRPAVARTVARRPEDLLLLLARVVAITLIGAAFARPVLRPTPGSVLRIVVADRSRAVASAREVADSVRRIGGADGVVVVFDSTARVIAGDSIALMGRSAMRGALSPALLTALRTASRLAGQADSVEITVVSPAVGEEVDAATDSIRALWPGTMRLARVVAQPVGAAARVVSVDWPDDGHAAGAIGRTPVDTVMAVVASGGRPVLVAPFVRRWRLDTTGARVVARWVDGEAAAVERDSGAACRRAVIVPRPVGGGRAPDVRRFAAAMAVGVPCLGDEIASGMAPSAWTVDTARSGRVASRVVAAAATGPNRLAAWLLAAALTALMIEPLVRLRRGGA